LDDDYIIVRLLPQTPSAYAEFRSVRFAFAPADTRDGKREPIELMSHNLNRDAVQP